MRTLAGVGIGAIGLGCMGTNFAYATGGRDDATSCEGGLVVNGHGHDTWVRPDGRPEALRAAIKNSLRRLRTDRLDPYYLHRIDSRADRSDCGRADHLCEAPEATQLVLTQADLAELDALPEPMGSRY